VEGHGGSEVGRAGEDGVPGGSHGGGVEEEISCQEAMDCGGLGQSSDKGFRHCVGGAEGSERNGKEGLSCL
jgi:hypothetical protein